MTTGVLMLDLEGLSLTDSEREVLRDPDVGGLILFSRNFSDPAQLTSLMRSIRAVRPDLMVAVDQEGGRVQRFREGFTRLPAMATLGQRYKQDPEQALIQARELGWLMAAELRAFDIDISFAPVLDLDWQRSSVIGDRAFATDAADVSVLAGAFMAGMHEAGMAATGKHFPGHGWVEADSHLELPIDQRLESAICDVDMQPFSDLITQGLDAIMPAHVVYTQVCHSPAGFSEYWLRTILRERLGFDGVIFSDDLTMEGASVAGSYAQRCDQAMAAGCDMVLVCNQPAAAREVLAHIKASGIKSAGRLPRMLGKPFKVDEARLAAARNIAGELLSMQA